MASRRKKSRRKPWVVLLALVLVLAVIAGACFYLFVYKGYTVDELLQFSQPRQPSLGQDQEGSRPSDGNDSAEKGGDSSDGSVAQGSIETGELSIHFLELGNKYAGDCTLIQYGDTEILIDAGSRQGSAETIVKYIQTYCTDGILEYVIATHADQDHISAFVGTTKAPGIFDSFECQTIIDFPLTNKTSQIYQNYCKKRDEEVENGAVHYTALQCWNNEDGASRSYSLGEGVTMSILYNYYYENYSSDENNYSVCMLLTQGDYHYLFTGDLEESGESYLVQYNELPQCKLFKGGHHGSKTSNTDALLSVVRPEVVCICCCAGSPEYTSNNDNTFPTQAAVDRIAKYTDRIYVTTLATDIDLEGGTWNYASMNGNIVVSSDGIHFSVVCSNNDTLLKDTQWFQENRVWNGA